MAALYDGLQFKTTLEAQWAAFFDLAEWQWRTNSVSVGNWSPDFRVTFPCNHSECGSSHTLLVAVLPLSSIEDVKFHPALDHMYGVNDESFQKIGASASAGAVFGSSPKATTWQMSHGAGGGVFNVSYWVDNADLLWSKAEGLVK